MFDSIGARTANGTSDISHNVAASAALSSHSTTVGAATMANAASGGVSASGSSGKPRSPWGEVSAAALASNATNNAVGGVDTESKPASSPRAAAKSSSSASNSNSNSSSNSKSPPTTSASGQSSLADDFAALPLRFVILSAETGSGPKTPLRPIAKHIFDIIMRVTPAQFASRMQSITRHPTNIIATYFKQSYVFTRRAHHLGFGGRISRRCFFTKIPRRKCESTNLNTAFGVIHIVGFFHILRESVLTRDNTFGERALISRVELLRKLMAVDEEFDRENATDSLKGPTEIANSVAAGSQSHGENSHGVRAASGIDALTASTGTGANTDHHASSAAAYSSASTSTTTTSAVTSASNHAANSAPVSGTAIASNHAANSALISDTATAAGASNHTIVVSVSAADFARRAAVHTELQLATRQAR